VKEGSWASKDIELIAPQPTKNKYMEYLMNHSYSYIQHYVYELRSDVTIVLNCRQLRNASILSE